MFSSSLLAKERLKNCLTQKVVEFVKNSLKILFWQSCSRTNRQVSISTVLVKFKIINPCCISALILSVVFLDLTRLQSILKPWQVLSLGNDSESGNE